MSYVIRDGEPIADGDIILPASVLHDDLFAAPAQVNPWPNNTIPYELDTNLNTDQRAVIDVAVGYFQRESAVRLRPKISSDLNWVRFTAFSEDYCKTTVGMAGGRQDIHFGNRCGPNEIEHEILHVIGTWHEQSRPDRDNFVIIFRDNILTWCQDQFDPHTLDPWVPAGPYDVTSLMHYRQESR